MEATAQNIKLRGDCIEKLLSLNIKTGCMETTASKYNTKGDCMEATALSKHKIKGGLHRSNNSLKI